MPLGHGVVKQGVCVQLPNFRAHDAKRDRLRVLPPAAILILRAIVAVAMWD